MLMRGQAEGLFDLPPCDPILLSNVDVFKDIIIIKSYMMMITKLATHSNVYKCHCNICIGHNQFYMILFDLIGLFVIFLSAG